MDTILQLLGQIVLVGGGATAIAYGLLKFIGQKWIDQKFAERLEEFKRKQTEILEEVRYDINARFSRVSKVHDKEFEVLSTAWRKLLDAYEFFAGITHPLQSYPDLDNAN
ncbi:hypothetical protein GQ464_002455 [Rhodocaloribacter litoris]|uniref:hypothetical protein n=1 Tax=Rhodocaloribacter litoris TaxID=2558931 RepID=UPI0014231C8A|nr:hypothetical protein [Rhodocaloribacter litoris]QXD15830.1 hypothetical protein GQ464_002455 [Rhodocaloribacter litoris]